MGVGTLVAGPGLPEQLHKLDGRRRAKPNAGRIAEVQQVQQFDRERLLVVKGRRPDGIGRRLPLTHAIPAIVTPFILPS